MRDGTLLSAMEARGAYPCRLLLSGSKPGRELRGATVRSLLSRSHPERDGVSVVSALFDSSGPVGEREVMKNREVEDIYHEDSHHHPEQSRAWLEDERAQDVPAFDSELKTPAASPSSSGGL